MTGHVAGVPVRNRHAVTFGRYYGISVLTCEPASKGGVENAVKLAKADIVPTETNLQPQYAIVDDVGLLPVVADAAEGLYRIVEAAYERRSVAISSNLHPSGFDELMPKTLATATASPKPCTDRGSKP